MESKWDFNAPKFIDFSNNEHLSTELERFFDHDRNNNNQEFNSPPVHGAVQQSPQELCLEGTNQDYNVQTPNRQTYHVPTPSRVLRSRLQNMKSSESNCDELVIINDENNASFAETKQCTLTPINEVSEKESSKSNASIIHESLKRISSLVSNVPKKKVQLTLPQTPKFASKSLMSYKRNSKQVEAKTYCSNERIKHHNNIATSTLRRSFKAHDMMTRLDVSMEDKLKNNSSTEKQSCFQLPNYDKNSNNVPFPSTTGLSTKITKNSQLNSSKILSTPNLANTLKKTTTVPVPFSFTAIKRSTRHSSKVVSEQSKPFKATPVPTSLYNKPKFKRNLKSLNITVPISPAFASKNCLKRKALPNDLETDIKKPKLQKLQSIQKSSTSVFKPKLVPVKTVPRPFSFETRERKKHLQKQEKKKETKVKEVATTKFKAQPAPTTFSTLPPKQVKKPTQVKPFQLHCHEKFSANKKIGKELEKKEETKENIAPPFKANRDYKKILNQKPWKPNLKQKQSTQPLQPIFHSQARLLRRAQLKKSSEDKRLYMQDEIALADKKSAALCSSKIKKLDICAKSLTVPLSPKFSSRLKKT